MLALAEVEARTCEGCASDLFESMDAATFQRKRLWVEDSAVCHVCEGKEAHRRKLKHQHENDPGYWDGRMIFASLRDRKEGDDGGTS